MRRLLDRDKSWYSIDDLPPVALRCQVWWLVHGVPEAFVAGRFRKPGRRADEWQWATTTKRGKIVNIPPQGVAGKAWADAPVCWRPVEPEKWVWPLGVEPPALAVHHVPRLATIGGIAYSETTAASGEDDEAGHGIDDDLPWWRDPSSIRYEPEGEVSREMAEGRVMRALAHCGSLTPRLRSGSMTILARLAEERTAIGEMLDDARVAASIILRFAPQQQDQGGEFLMAMGWFTSLDPIEDRPAGAPPWALNRRQRVLWLRSLDENLSFGDVAHAITPAAQKRRGRYISQQRAREIYETTIDAVWRIANGKVARMGRAA